MNGVLITKYSTVTYCLLRVGLVGCLSVNIMIWRVWTRPARTEKRLEITFVVIQHLYSKNSIASPDKMPSQWPQVHHQNNKSSLTCFLDALFSFFLASCSSFISSLPSCSDVAEGFFSSAATFAPSSLSSSALVLSLLLNAREVDWKELDVEVQGSGSTLVTSCLFLVACCLSTVHSSLMKTKVLERLAWARVKQRPKVFRNSTDDR